MEDLKEKHRTGRNEIDHPDRAPTGLPYHMAAARQQQIRSLQRQQALQHVETTQIQQTLVKDDEEEEDYDAWLDELDDDPGLDAIRQQRLQEIKQQQQKQAENIAKGHGSYRYITQDEFLPECTGSDFVLVHFYHSDFETCEIMHHHLQKMATKHLNVKFVKIDAQKAPFFVAKLQVRVMPTLLLFRDGKTVERLLGFQDLAPNPCKPNEFPTARLEQWLSRAGAIEHTPDDLDLEQISFHGRAQKVVYRGGIDIYDEDR